MSKPAGTKIGFEAGAKASRCSDGVQVQKSKNTIMKYGYFQKWSTSADPLRYKA